MAITLMAVVGCGVGPAALPVDPGTWLARQGGPADPGLLPRVEAAARRLQPAGDGRIRRVLVAATDRVGAWSWPDGTVVLTRAVVERLDDDEIAAVLAHESGHLEAEPARAGASSDGGRRLRARLDEQAADHTGAVILVARGIDRSAMPRMLREIANLAGTGTSSGRAALRRAAILESRSATH